MKRWLSLFFLVLVLHAAAHPWKAQHYVIVDTDCGLDDFRALNLMLASPQIRVLAVVTSPGVVSAELGSVKVKALLRDLHHDGIPVGAWTASDIKAKNCPAALRFEWGSSVQDSDTIANALDVVRKVFRYTREPVQWVALGSLDFTRHAADSLDHFVHRVQEVVWLSSGSMDSLDFNYYLAPEACRAVRNLGIPCHAIAARRMSYPDSLQALLNSVSGNRYKRLAASLQEAAPFATTCFDEESVWHLIQENSYTADTSAGGVFYRNNGTMALYDFYRQLLGWEPAAQNQVLSTFPMQAANYLDDVSTIADQTIRAYGQEEWIAGVIANEMHRHLGVYAITGVKMGIRAKEYFGAGLDELCITSYTGLVPPFSCMNDGLQISTGATLGHGLIWVAGDSLQLPRADFSYMGTTIRMQLKEEYRLKLARRIREYEQFYGLRSDIYWELVRGEALKIWRDWNRYDIFDITVCKTE